MLFFALHVQSEQKPLLHRLSAKHDAPSLRRSSFAAAHLPLTSSQTSGAVQLIVFGALQAVPNGRPAVQKHPLKPLGVQYPEEQVLGSPLRAFEPLSPRQTLLELQLRLRLHCFGYEAQFPWVRILQIPLWHKVDEHCVFVLHLLPGASRQVPLLQVLLEAQRVERLV